MSFRFRFTKGTPINKLLALYSVVHFQPGQVTQDRQDLRRGARQSDSGQANSFRLQLDRRKLSLTAQNHL